MRKQQKVWQNEHKKVEAFKSYEMPEPASVVVQFIDFLKRKNLNLGGKVIDIGCGKGRNSIYLAELGFEVYAVDYIEEALNYGKNKADQRSFAHSIKFFNISIDEKWPFENNFFNYAIDCFSSIDIETREGREIYKKEMFRTLTPGGYALVSVVSAEDEFEAEMMKQSPGKEPNSVIWLANGKFQKDYTEQELREFYKEFKIIEITEIQKKSRKLDKDFTATIFRVILRKP